jgi:hypothetical protein
MEIVFINKWPTIYERDKKLRLQYCHCKVNIYKSSRLFLLRPYIMYALFKAVWGSYCQRFHIYRDWCSVFPLLQVSSTFCWWPSPGNALWCGVSHETMTARRNLEFTGYRPSTLNLADSWRPKRKLKLIPGGRVGTGTTVSCVDVNQALGSDS